MPGLMIAEPPCSASLSAVRGTGEDDLSSPAPAVTVLIADGDTFTSGYVGAVMEQFGMTVVGPFRSGADALARVDAGSPAAAVLAVRLDDGPAWPLARGLLQRRVPVLFLCDAGAVDLPQEFEAQRRIATPFAAFQVALMVQELTAQSPAGPDAMTVLPFGR